MIIIIKILLEKEWNTLLIKVWLKIKRRDDDDDEYGGVDGNDSDDVMRLWLKIDVDIC